MYIHNKSSNRKYPKISFFPPSPQHQFPLRWTRSQQVHQGTREHLYLTKVQHPDTTYSSFPYSSVTVHKHLFQRAQQAVSHTNALRRNVFPFYRCTQQWGVGDVLSKEQVYQEIFQSSNVDNFPLLVLIFWVPDVPSNSLLHDNWCMKYA